MGLCCRSADCAARAVHQEGAKFRDDPLLVALRAKGPVNLPQRGGQIALPIGELQRDIGVEGQAEAQRANRRTVVRLAEVFDVTCDYLLIDDTPRRPHHSGEDALGDRLAHLGELDTTDLGLVSSLVDALVTKTRLKALAGGIS
jgi:hypothetical protein